MEKLVAVLVSAWLGLQLSAGYLVAPILFHHLDKMMAGLIAGELFDIIAYIGLIVWILTYFLAKRQLAHRLLRSHTRKFIMVLILFLAINQFLVTPIIKALKINHTNWLHSLIGGTFGQWHGVSSIVYMLCSLLAIFLVFRLIKFDWR